MQDKGKLYAVLSVTGGPPVRPHDVGAVRRLCSGARPSVWPRIWSSSCGGLYLRMDGLPGAGTRARRSRWRLWRIFWKKKGGVAAW